MIDSETSTSSARWLARRAWAIAATIAVAAACSACQPEAEERGSESAKSSDRESSAETGLSVRVADGKLSVDLDEAMRREVMALISEQSDVEIIFTGAGQDTTLTDKFEDLPLEAGIRRLLRDSSSAFIVEGDEPDRTLKRAYVALADKRTSDDQEPLEVFGAGRPQASPKGFEQQSLPEGLQQLIDQTRSGDPSELPPELIEALGQDIVRQLNDSSLLKALETLEALAETDGVPPEDLERHIAELIENQVPEELLNQLMKSMPPANER